MAARIGIAQKAIPAGRLFLLMPRGFSAIFIYICQFIAKVLNHDGVSRF
jgi:hypothetical protein